MSWQSVARTSAARASPRRVGLMPTTAAPARAAPFSQKRYSATLGSRTPMWTAGRRRRGSGPGRPAAAPSTASRQLHGPSPSSTPGRSSSARAASRSATVVTAASHPGRRRTRERSRASTVAAPHRCHDPPQLRLEPARAVPPRRRPRRWPAPTARAPDQHARAPEGERLGGVGGPAYAAVDVDLGPPRHGVDDLAQHVGGGRRVVQLAGPVVGHDDRRRPGVHATGGVVGPLHALHHHGQACSVRPATPRRRR